MSTHQHELSTPTIKGSTPSPSRASFTSNHVPEIFHLIERGEWCQVVERCRTHPNEAKVWVTLKKVSSSSRNEGGKAGQQGIQKQHWVNNSSINVPTEDDATVGNSSANNRSVGTATSSKSAGSNITISSSVAVQRVTCKALHHACHRLRSIHSRIQQTLSYLEEVNSHHANNSVMKSIDGVVTAPTTPTRMASVSTKYSHSNTNFNPLLVQSRSRTFSAHTASSFASGVLTTTSSNSSSSSYVSHPNVTVVEPVEDNFLTSLIYEDPWIEACKAILALIDVHPEAVEQRESRHGCLPIHLAVFAMCPTPLPSASSILSSLLTQSDTTATTTTTAVAPILATPPTTDPEHSFLLANNTIYSSIPMYSKRRCRSMDFPIPSPSSPLAFENTAANTSNWIRSKVPTLGGRSRSMSSVVVGQGLEKEDIVGENHNWAKTNFDDMLPQPHIKNTELSYEEDFQRRLSSLHLKTDSTANIHTWTDINIINEETSLPPITQPTLEDLLHVMNNRPVTSNPHEQAHGGSSCMSNDSPFSSAFLSHYDESILSSMNNYHNTSSSTYYGNSCLPSNRLRARTNSISSTNHIHSCSSTSEKVLPNFHLHRYISNAQLREDYCFLILNALIQASPKSIRLDSEGSRLPLHTAVAGRAILPVIQTLVRLYPDAARHRNKEGYLPLHLAAHWGVSSPLVAPTLLAAYPDACLGKNRWERTPLEEALAIAGENGRMHQIQLVRALRRHPAYWCQLIKKNLSHTTGNDNRRIVEGSFPYLDSNVLAEFLDEDVIGDVLTPEVQTQRSDSIYLPPDSQRQANHHDDLSMTGNFGINKIMEAESNRNRSVSASSIRSPPRYLRRSIEDTIFEQQEYNSGDLKNDVYGSSVPVPSTFVAGLDYTNLVFSIKRRLWPQLLNWIEQNPAQISVLLKTAVRAGYTARVTVLYLVCERNPPLQLVQILVDCYTEGAMIRKSPGGQLPLHAACTWGASSDVITLLIEMNPLGCKQSDDLGNLPLHCACFSGASEEVVAALLQVYPRSVKVKNEHGSVPGDIVRRLRHGNRRELLHIIESYERKVSTKHRRSSQSATSFTDASSQAPSMSSDPTNTVLKKSNEFNVVQSSDDCDRALVWL